MFSFFKNNTKELDTVFLEFENFYKNNYKDEAHKSFAKALKLYEELKDSGKLKGKTLDKYTKRFNEYKEKLKTYTHYDRIGW